MKNDVNFLRFFLKKIQKASETSPDITTTTTGEQDKRTEESTNSEVESFGTTSLMEGGGGVSGSSSSIGSSSSSSSSSSTSTGTTTSIGTSVMVGGGGGGSSGYGSSSVGSSSAGLPDTSTTQHVEQPTEHDHDTTYTQYGGGAGGDHHGSTTDEHTSTMSLPATVAPDHRERDRIPAYIPPATMLPPFVYTNPTTRMKPKNRINSEAGERTAMIIGIVAGALIAVILVILLVLWFKSNGDATYKTEHDKSSAYGQGPNAALLGNARGSDAHHHQINGSTMPLNGSLKNGVDKSNMGNNGNGNNGNNGSGGLIAPKPKKRDSKDIKEWYV